MRRLHPLYIIALLFFLLFFLAFQTQRMTERFQKEQKRSLEIQAIASKLHALQDSFVYATQKQLQEILTKQFAKHIVMKQRVQGATLKASSMSTQEVSKLFRILLRNGFEIDFFLLKKKGENSVALEMDIRW